MLEALGVGLFDRAPHNLCFSRSCAVLPLPADGGGDESVGVGRNVVADCEN